MPEKKTIRRAQSAKREGDAPSTQAGEFVREEMEHIRQGKHGARSTKQAIAIGLSKARRAGVKLPAPARGSVPERTRKKAARDTENGARKATEMSSRKRSAGVTRALKREGKSAASAQELAAHSRTVAKKRTAAQRSSIGKKAARTRSMKG